jgi:hypothetical protein
MNKKTLFLTLASILIALVGCGPSWEATLIQPDGSPFAVNRDTLDSLAEFAEEEGVPVERVLFAGEHYAVERLIVTDADGTRREYDWAQAASSAWWLDDGQVAIGGEIFSVSRVEVEPPALLGQVEASITDIAPTVAAVLGLPTPSQATGRALDAPRADHVLLLFLDGLGYVRYTEALEGGLIPYLATLEKPYVSLTTYPPCTAVSTASLLTGAPPSVHGATQRSIRKTETETLFDAATAAGLRVVAVEGNALSFNLRNAELQLSGDRDGNGSTDDNVLANALAVLEEGMPDLFFVHFHGIDDAGHEYGPGAPEEETTIREVDAAVGQIVEAVPPGTLVIIFADHGMHRVNESGRLGNHEYLIERDMFIPIQLTMKQ